MQKIFGFDIGTTSIGSVVIDYDPDAQSGTIHHMGVRIFPEAREEDGTPLNQRRREKRLVRRQVRRRRQRRRQLNETLLAAGLLPPYGSDAWAGIMGLDPYELRRRGLEEALAPHELGRAFYHLSKRRHFKGRDLEASETAETGETEKANAKATENADEKKAQAQRVATEAALKESGLTLGAWLEDRPESAGKRRLHATRQLVREEFDRLWEAQAVHHPVLNRPGFRETVTDAIFAQRPVFWRKNTLGECRFMPKALLCPKGAWLSLQKRMLEKLNNLFLAGGNARPLDDAERAAILAQLQGQKSMSWGGIRKVLKPLFKERGEADRLKSLKFNLEIGGEKGLPGNPVEAALIRIFGSDWPDHPHRDAIREALHQRLWSADYEEIGEQRVVILPAERRTERRRQAAESFVTDFGVTPEQAAQLQNLHFPTGWEPYSVQALQLFLPQLEAGVRFGALINGPDYEEWRRDSFPDAIPEETAGLSRLPSPASRSERAGLAAIRNPTVVRVQNELRKVVNNLISVFGKPDRIRVEVAREVGKSRRERKAIQDGQQRQEKARKKAEKELKARGIPEPSRRDIQKWLLLKESQDRCPYTGEHIGFDALFGPENRFDIEHIWPRSRSFDDSFRNKTLCRRDINIAKGNRTPFEYFQESRPEEWEALKTRLSGKRPGDGLPPAKIKRFLAERIPEDFANRQLTDTSYAARQAVEALRRLWPEQGRKTEVHVETVTGTMTGKLRKWWGLNNLLSEDGEKNRADHRHHAVDALVVACTHPQLENQMTQYWKAKEDPRTPDFQPAPPWATIRPDAAAVVAGIIVSHRVRKKVSGLLHKETIYGEAGKASAGVTGADSCLEPNREAGGGKAAKKDYRCFVTRKPVTTLTKSQLPWIRDPQVRETVIAWVEAHDGDLKKAFATYPTLGPNGPEIRRVRLLVKQQLHLMVPAATGHADLGNNHHIAIYRRPNGEIAYEVVSLYEAATRLRRREPVVRRSLAEGDRFLMSLAQGDMIRIPEGERKGLLIVQSIWAAGQIVTSSHVDATKDSLWQPTVGSLINKFGAIKVSVDPIGRIRTAND